MVREDKQITMLVIICTAIVLSMVGQSEQATSYKYPNDGDEYVIYGFYINNENNKGPCDTKPVVGRVHQKEGDAGVLCGTVDVKTATGSKSANVDCPKPIQGINLEVTAKDGGSLSICKLEVIARPVCKLPQVWSDDEWACLAPKPQPSCRVGMFDFCHRAGDCYLRDIKHINTNAEGCKDACSRECKCVSVQQNGNNCWLKDHRCSAGELNWNNAHNDWVKVNKGDGCAGWGRQQTVCRASMYDYCHRAGDCYLRDIRHINANAQRCRDACSQDCKCVSVQHRGNDCWLKHHRCSAGELNWNAGYNDFVKVNKGEGCAGYTNNRHYGWFLFRHHRHGFLFG